MKKMNLPNKNALHPNNKVKSLCYIKNVVKNPNIIIGDYTYYDDCDTNGEDFEKHVTHFYPFSHDHLVIGKFCAIAKGVTFVMNDANHRMNCSSTYPFYIMGGKWGNALAPHQNELPNKGDTIVGNDVWIGQNVTIMPGVRIGDGAIIGYNATVASDVPAYSIVAGNPAKIIRKRFDDETIKLLEEFKWWDKPIDEIDKLLPMITSSDMHKVKKFLMKQKRNPLRIRLATFKDFPTIIKIYEQARDFMIKNNNPTQWGRWWPDHNFVKASIIHKDTYVIINHHDKIEGTFAMIIGEDPSYKIIKNGHWLNNQKPYITLHRLASNFTTHGVASTMFEFAKTFGLNIRVDTHKANKIMQKAFLKNGFKYTGIIYIDHAGKKSPRLAYQFVPK